MGDIVEFCDGWMPIEGLHDVDGKLAQLRGAATAAGRDPGTIEVGLFNAPADADTLVALAEAGFAGAILYLPSGSPPEVIAKLDEYRVLANSVAG